MKVTLIVLDSVGIGEAPDADAYDDLGSATAQRAAESINGLNAPTLQKLGFGNTVDVLPHGIPIAGLPAADSPLASFGAMQEVSEGKDTITGHWEIAGLKMIPGFRTFPPGPPSFPADLLETFEKENGRKTIGNKAASGTAIIEELGKQHLRTGELIVYTSGDSVMQIAAHNDVVPLDELYEACRIGRRLCDPLRIGRVIARPFRGDPGAFERTEDRKDFAFETEDQTILQKLTAADVPVYAVGKIEDIFAQRGITHSNHTGNNRDSQQAVDEYLQQMERGFIFANFIDFDMHYGHRRDPEGYARCIEQTDEWLTNFLPRMSNDDILIITADHGNDPTYKGTDHTREYVPLLVYRPGSPAHNLGIRHGFYDIAQSIAAQFGLTPMPHGVSFL